MLFIRGIQNILLLSSLIFFTSVSDAQNSLTEPVIEDLQNFTDDFIQKNSILRIKNSQSMFDKSVRKPKRGLLPEAVFKSLGYRLRDPFIVLPPELSTHLYRSGDNQTLYFEELHDLEKIWALLSSTRARVIGEDSWVSKQVNRNVVLDAIDTWYRIAHKSQYTTWLRELKRELVKESRDLAFNKEEFSKKNYGQANIQVLELLADNALLRQYLDAESAYLFLRTDARDLPKTVLNKAQYGFEEKLFCQPDSTQMQIGNIFLKASFPHLITILNSDDVVDKVWQLAEASRILSKKLLRSPSDKQLQAANYVLSETVLRMMLELNQKRLNKFSQNDDNFFVDMNENHTFTDGLQQIEEYIELQNEIFNLILKDIFIANERISSANLIIFLACIDSADTHSNTMKVIQIVENYYFKGLDFPQAITIKKDVLTLKKRWNGKRLMSHSSFVAQQEKSQQVTVLRKAEQKTKNLKIKLIPLPSVESKSNIVKSDSISDASSKQAAQWLLEKGWKLSSYEDMQKLTQEDGYSIQIITTSSVSEAVDAARRYAVNDEVKVYLSSVTVNGVLERRYKVLVTFLSGGISSERIKGLQKKAAKNKSFLKPYWVINKDILR